MSLLAGGAFAQDEDDGGPMTQGDDARYLRITHVKFEPGARSDAMEMISDVFMPAGELAGTPPPLMVIHYQTGEWDMGIVWELQGGMADLEWYRSPNNIKWWAALVELVGGEDEAEEMWATYQGMIAESVTEVGHDHTGETE
jgi:hypothetical protein